MDDTIQVHLKVPRRLWMELRKDAMMRGRSAQGHVLEMFRVAYGVASKVPSVERKEPSVRSYEVKQVEVPGGWSGETQVKPTPLKTKFGAPVEAEVPMAKCRKCGESFPVADMVTEPKSGKLFCGDCVENLKNGQA